MREVLIFAAGASIAGTIFFVSLIELLFTLKRRRVKNDLEIKMKELKASYNESINKMVLEEEAKLEEVEKHVEVVTSQVTEEKTQLTEEFEGKIEDIKATSEKALASAKAKAKKLEQEAKLKAEEYLASRQQEVEEELMNLVMSVTKKVMPEGLTYEIQKDLVMKALRDVKANTRKA